MKGSLWHLTSSEDVSLLSVVSCVCLDCEGEDYLFRLREPHSWMVSTNDRSPPVMTDLITLRPRYQGEELQPGANDFTVNILVATQEGQLVHASIGSLFSDLALAEKFATFWYRQNHEYIAKNFPNLVRG